MSHLAYALPVLSPPRQQGVEGGEKVPVWVLSCWTGSTHQNAGHLLCNNLILKLFFFFFFFFLVVFVCFKLPISHKLCQNLTKSQYSIYCYCISKHQINLEIQVPRHNLLSLCHPIISWCLPMHYYILSSTIFSATSVKLTYSNVLLFLFFNSQMAYFSHFHSPGAITISYFHEAHKQQLRCNRPFTFAEEIGQLLTKQYRLSSAGTH